ncbi:MAG: N-acetylmuramoyl-L-alanine amidase [Oscillatoria sp. PMC 1051.18]|nr:N-acetylmuramoyl-L-alanine amidase [Oscillatoria sp. PMC 1050.18]MEC5030143.1 N-acetylmuramoyl-L-alanine amidase [Oscillatoria sp. PMC 1051.18]
MRFHWLLLSFLSVLLFSSPAEAGRLLFWRFDKGQNRLSFSTNEGVQPRAQLITNPSRIVIDLPGTSLGRPSVRQNLGGLLTELRIGQVDSQTTRLVIELAPGYTVDPQQVRVRGISPTQWTVVLPPPQRIVQPQPQPIQPPPTQQTSPQNEQPRVQSPPQPTRENRSVETLDDFQVTRSGFFVRLNDGEPKKIKITRSRDRREIDIQLEGVTLPNRLAQENLEVNRYGVSQVAFRQGSNSPPVARITLEVDRDSPDWKASFSSGGLVILPDGVPARQLEDASSSSPEREVRGERVERRVIIEAVDLTVGGSQLIIRANQSVRATSSWNRQEGTYEISIPNAQLADTIRGPSLPAGSTISQVRIRQQDRDTVVVAVKPGVGVAIGQLNQPTENSISLELEQTRQATLASSSNNSTIIPVPPPERTEPTPNNNLSSPPSRSLPRVPNGRALVAIDPGHGGKDPGAIGRGGLQEKDVILPIAQQVGQYLEQQGVNAMMTRSDDRFISLEGRVQMANRAGANLFVSIHANAISLSRPDVNGLETYHYRSGLRLAQTIHRSILRNVNVRDRGVRQARFYVLRRTSMPSVLVEVGFVTGRDDAANLSNPTYRNQMAQAIALGILEYIQQNRV